MPPWRPQPGAPRGIVVVRIDTAAYGDESIYEDDIEEFALMLDALLVARGDADGARFDRFPHELRLSMRSEQPHRLARMIAGLTHELSWSKRVDVRVAADAG